MKKIFSILLALCLLCVLGACGNDKSTHKLSLGTVLSEDIEALTVTATTAAVVTDNEGKIVLCRLDSAEARATVKDGAAMGSTTERSKYEAGEDYGMVEGGGAMSEWYKQAAFFEEHIKGMTVVEVEKIKTGDAELTSGCTIDVTDFVRAVSAAIKSDKKVGFTPEGDMSAGVSILASSEGGSDSAKYLYGLAATVICDGKVTASVIDSAEATVTLSDGKGKSFAYSGTKNELGADYGMVEKGGAISEWFEQAKAYAKSAEGKTDKELADLPVESVSGCTIDAEPLKAALLRAAENAR